MPWKIIIIITIIFMQICTGQISRPQVETNPNLLDSFIPASMQIIAHITELMKYDLKPTTNPSITTTTTTTLRPTKPHNPGIFAPQLPPGPEVYFAKGVSFEEYIERLKNPSGYNNYFDRYRYPVDEEMDETNNNPSSIRESRIYEEIPQNLELVVGKGASDLVKLIISNEDDFEVKDFDEQIQKFSKNYDDSDFNYQLLRQKKVPPTRAYVGLLSLYDLLNKESKKLGLNKYNGYSQNVLKELADVSTGTSSYQLKSVLNKISQRKDTKNPQIIKRVDELVKDLEQSTSYISSALRYIPPLAFVL